MQVKVNGQLYECFSAYGRMKDGEWDGRDSIILHLPMTYAEAAAVFVNGAQWALVDEANEYDKSAYSLAGDITDKRDGTVKVKMGMPLEVEDLRDFKAAAEAAQREGVNSLA